MDKFGSLLLIDNLVKLYPAYDHEQIFRLELDLAYNLLLINKTEAKISSDANVLRRSMKK